MKICVSLILTLVCLFIACEARAACAVTTTSINFGNYDVGLTLPNDSTGTITVTCDEAPPPNVTIMIGPSPNSGVFNPRRMKHLTLSDFLQYNLFTDASRTVIWGNGTQGTSTIIRKATKAKPEIATVYGRIPAGQDVSAGQYSDTLTATIVW